MKQPQFEPYVPADRILPEFTWTSVIVGALLAVVFGGANAYLGLKVGMTVSASIPAAVISMGIIRKLLRRNSILENNMVQTIGSAGESLAAGAIFTLPTLFMWAAEGLIDPPPLLEITLITLCGGLLGVLLMVPLRSALIVKEHGVLPYPEGQACAGVLIAGEQGGDRSAVVFRGLGIAAGYKFLTDGLRIFPSEVDYAIPSYKGAGIGIDVLPALAGVGYICGPRISSYMLAGGVVAWLVLMPMIALFGGSIILFPAEVPVSVLLAAEGPMGLWKTFIRYIGAGAVACGGILSLLKSLPLILRTFRDAVGSYGRKNDIILRTERDLPTGVIAGGILAIGLALWLVPAVPVSPVGAIMIVVFGFFFATVSARMVGLIGSSNNPVSGMAIATLILATSLLKTTGSRGVGGMVAAIAIGSVICIVAAIAGDTSQDMKTGFLVGATPYKQQTGELVGCTVSAVAIGAILYLLNTAYGFGSEQLSAPQATLMKLVVEGVMGGTLPWNLVFVGVFAALAAEILGIPVLPFAIGIYLPIHLSTPIMAGGLIRLYLEKRKYATESQKQNTVQTGILYTSGLIAGEGVVGILLAVFTILPVGDSSLAAMLDLSGHVELGDVGALVSFGLILLSILGATIWSRKLRRRDNEE